MQHRNVIGLSGQLLSRISDRTSNEQDCAGKKSDFRMLNFEMFPIASVHTKGHKRRRSEHLSNFLRIHIGSLDEASCCFKSLYPAGGDPK